MPEDKKRGITRRAALKYGGGIVASAAVGGTIGHLAGTAYDYLTQLYGKSVGFIGQELVDLDARVDKMEGLTGKIAQTTKSVEKKRANLWQRIFGINEKDQERRRTEYEIKTEEDKREISETNDLRPYNEEPESRRKFILSLLGQAHEHPKTTGTIIGAAYGGIKAAAKGRNKYKTESRNEERDIKIGNLEGQAEQLRFQVYTLKKQISAYEEKIKEAGEDRRGYSEQISLLRTQISDLTSKYGEFLRKYDENLKTTPEKRAPETEKAKEKDEINKSKLIVMLLGFLLLFISFSISLIKPITASVIGNAQITNNLFSISLFCLSLIFLFIGIKK